MHLQAYLYARAAEHVLDRLATLPRPESEALWQGRGEPRAGSSSRSPVPVIWFGPFSPRKVRFVRHIFARVLERFERGFPSRRGPRPVRFQCLPGDARRCRDGVLANASIFGTVRVCPRLLAKSLVVGGMVVLHEFLHQKLGVGDQRDPVCRQGAESRCYRAGARRLVRHGKTAKALRNNDNYAFFARAVYLAALRANRSQGGP